VENLSVSQAAEYLGITVSTLYNWVHARKIPFRKHGRKLVFNKASLERWSRERETPEIDQT
jgi:excisionase family DNA binding protein